MSKEGFPDKKDRHIEFSEVAQYMQDGRRLIEQYEIGQKEATWIPRGEYKDLPIAVLLMTDTHFGSVRVNTELLQEHLQIVEDTPNFFMVHNGDHTDNFNSTFHASGMSENPLSPQIPGKAWSQRLIELDRKSKIGSLGYGNHDDWMFDASQFDYYDTFFSQINAPIFTQGGELNVMVEGQLYQLAIAHRYWGTSKLNPTNACKRYMEHEYPEADIIMLGHTHQSEGLHFERGGKDRIAVIGGTYKDSDAWARKRGIGGRSGSPGWVVMLWPGKRQMQLYKDVKVAQEVIQTAIAMDELVKGDSYTRTRRKR
jgi:predicted phosphodiesterase